MPIPKLVLSVISIVAISYSQASAGPVVAVLGNPSGGAAWNTDIQSKLMATGLFSAVDVFDLSSPTQPSLAQLQAYHSVLVYSGSLLPNSLALGNTLADYVDGGGGVVLAAFANVQTNELNGRFATSDYWGIEPGTQTQFVRLHLGTIHNPSSPLLAGVTSFDGGSSSFHGLGSVQVSSTVVADWSNGSPLVVTRTIGSSRRVDLNFYPVSSDQRSDLWLSNTDGARLMANSLIFAGVPEPSTLALAAFGFVGLAAWAWRRKQSRAVC